MRAHARIISAFVLLAIAAVACSRSGAGASANLAVTARAQDASPRPVQVTLEPWEFEGQAGRVQITATHRIHSAGLNASLESRLPLLAQRAMDRYQVYFGALPFPARTLDVYVLDDRRDWETLTRRITGPDARVYLRIPRGGFAWNGTALLYDIGPHDTLAVLAHEGWHQYTQSTFRDQLPLWAEEGIATAMEGFRWRLAEPEFSVWANLARFDQLREANKRDTLVPLSELVRQAPQDLLGADRAAVTYYAQVWALVLFLEEHPDPLIRARWRTLIADAASGKLRSKLRDEYGRRGAYRALRERRGGRVFESALGAPPDLFEAEYRLFVSKLTEQGARDDIAQGRRPGTLGPAPKPGL